MRLTGRRWTYIFVPTEPPSAAGSRRGYSSLIFMPLADGEKISHFNSTRQTGTFDTWPDTFRPQKAT